MKIANSKLYLPRVDVASAVSLIGVGSCCSGINTGDPTLNTPYCLRISKAVLMPVAILLMFAVALPLRAVAQQPQSGDAGVADQAAVVNFSELARQEALAPPAPRPPRVIHSPMPGPARLTQPDSRPGNGPATTDLTAPAAVETEALSPDEGEILP